MRKIKSKKYTGVYYSELQNGDKTYYITFKILEGKKIWIKIGKYSEGVRENYCFNRRSEQINKVRLGEELTVGKKQKNSLTLNDLADLYFFDKAVNNKGVEVEKLRYGKHIRNGIGKLPIDSITLTMLKDLQKLKKSEGYANQTNNHILQLVQTIFNNAIDEKKVKDNPCSRIIWLKVKNNRERFLSIEEIKILLDNIEDEQTALFVKLSLITGARKAGVLAITKKDAQNRVVIHTLRHTFASHLAMNETPIYTIQKLMNYKSISMTLRYAKLAPDSGKTMVNNLYK